MRISIKSPFAEARGSYKSTDLVYIRGSGTGEIYARSKTKPTNPRTPDQTTARKFATEASRCWTSLSPQARADWERFTLMFACVAKRRRAMDVCREAQRMRLILGLPTTNGAPRHGFPAPVTGLSLETSPDPSEFRLRIEHAVDAPAGHMVLVRITPPMPTVARTPRPQQARAICGLGPQSAVALPDHGGVVVFANARFAVEPGTRFGIALTVIRVEDGLASPVAFFDLIRP